MNWRPWVVAASLMLAVLLNGTLLAVEEVKPPDQKVDPTVKITDKLATLRYSAASRISDFREFGLPDDLGQEAQQKAVALDKERGPLLDKLLKDNAEVATRTFCPGSSVPQRYAALGVLVFDDGEHRRVMHADEITALTVQDWYLTSPVEDVYETVELNPDRKADATAMGVAAILLRQEDAVIEGTSPWGEGSYLNAWSMSSVMSTYQNEKIRNKLIDYFALMHLLTELANNEKGVCN
jgi:hypothetical protein